eukprot:CAMPEP_0204019016 /NCGR_PEP_ID=MMETSP0360-20130528/28467_1 /ASSEMBLY_ACC=CAM_ASM_000342 /TAXON_ID=268821 /ORGANISM="Scrippsiella Hangoei, Strain SHTV-5" /LENGTH=38 /DNA_ID= /DNA_START= /DNA_END= /DNA_ORIENTATION=
MTAEEELPDFDEEATTEQTDAKEEGTSGETKKGSYAAI